MLFWALECSDLQILDILSRAFIFKEKKRLICLLKSGIISSYISEIIRLARIRSTTSIELDLLSNRNVFVFL